MPRRRPVRPLLIGLVGLLVVVALVVAAGVVVLVRRPLPQRDGTLKLPALEHPVQVISDGRGIPQVYADTADDLFTAQGYLHARDRFFEMDFRRHVTAGRLSELVGASKDAMSADVAIRTMGWRRVAEQELGLLDPATRRYLQDYADGVNAYLRGRSPSDVSVAYTVLGLQNDQLSIEPWTPVDSLAWLKAMAWDLRTNIEDELARAIDASVLPVERIEELYPPYPYDQHAPITNLTSPAGGAAPAADSIAGVRRAESSVRAASVLLRSVPAMVGAGEGIGSNSWVVSGARTASGKPLLANDPHLSVSQPGIWYQMGLHCRVVSGDCPFDVAGFTFSGLPGVVIGHNAKIAWGFTNLGADVTDLFLEQVSGDSYLRDNAYVPLETRKETIKVAGAADVTITVRSTVHGPIISDAIPDAASAGASAPVVPGAPPRGKRYDVSLAWTALQPGRTADAIFALDSATDWSSFRRAAAAFEVPSQNIVYADTSGHIGYQAPGKIPVRAAGQDGRWPTPGWLSRNDWQGFVPFDALPRVFDPPEGFIVTANQAVTPPGYPAFLTSDWDYGYRSQRIRTLITEHKGKLTTADMSRIQLDNRNDFAPVLTAALLKIKIHDPFVRQAQDLLRGWDFQQGTDSAAAAYFNTVWRTVLDQTFSDDLPPGQRPTGGSRWMQVVTRLLDNPNDPYWDDRRTVGVVESRDEILRRSMIIARNELTRDLGKDPTAWKWGKLHRLTLRQQPLGSPAVPAPIRSLFNRGPIEVAGGTSIVDATAWDATQGYDVTAAPSMRMVVDLGNLDRSTWVQLTGNSGHPGDSHYSDQIDAWASGQTFDWPFTRRAVTTAGGDVQTLTPGS